MTTASMTATRRSGLIAFPTFSSGRSGSADIITRCYVTAREHLLGSVSLRGAAEQALDELSHLWQEASADGWDGYGAKRISADAYVHARAFIQALPTTVPKPEVGADPDGEISLDWLFAAGIRFSLSIGERGRLTFVSLLGHRAIQGTEWFDTGIPSTVLDELTTIASEGRRAGHR